MVTFTPSEVSERSELFAEVVFNRPLDHVYSYAVPKSLRAIVIGR